MDIEPCYFGAPGMSLFGCYHAPRNAEPRDCGVMLCHSLGYEYVRCHRAHRQLSGRLARAGFPVLRFDYFGCGDSPGESEEARIARWLRDTLSSSEHLRRRCGSTKVCMVGIRLGATLAMIAGSQRGDIDLMVLWDPVIKGESFLDEMRAQHAAHKEELRRYYGAALERESDDGHLEVLGFRLSVSMTRDLEELDLLKVQRRPAKRVLLIETDENGGASALKSHLEGLGAGPDFQHISEAPIWLAEPYEAIVPQRTINALVSWISRVER